MTTPLLWLVVGLVLVAAELVSGEFVLLMLGGGALVAAGAALVVGPVASAVVFGVASVLLLLGLRPALRRRLDRSVPHSPSRAEAVVGGTATVVARVDGHGGRVRIGDDEWSARSFDEAQVIEPGERGHGRADRRGDGPGARPIIIRVATVRRPTGEGGTAWTVEPCCSSSSCCSCCWSWCRWSRRCRSSRRPRPR